MKITKLYSEFFESEKAGGLMLIFCTAISLLIANSSLSEHYINFWQTPIFHHPLQHWINDGLMTVFFLLIGLELERELYNGELSSLKSASLPLFGALGGMIIPAVLFYFINKGTATQSGIGIPMATDIAFAIGILSLLGNKVPGSLKIFLTALAVMDDLGAIIIIAVFYTNNLLLLNLAIALGIFGALLILNRLKVNNLIPYLIGGVFMWYFMLQSGVHATITGIMLAFALPFGKGDETSISIKLQHVLHKPVAFIILPIFALANTCVVLAPNWHLHLLDSNSLGIFVGLVIGKPLGISLFVALAVFIGICKLPEDLKWKHLFGATLLGGIGFTMSIFISLLAFTNSDYINTSKIAILLASLISALIGFCWLKVVLKTKFT